MNSSAWGGADRAEQVSRRVGQIGGRRGVKEML